MTPVVGVGALLLAPDGRVLVGHRVKRGERPTWCLPGGHVEPGETFETAALREVTEETGIPAARVHDARVFAVTLRTEAPGTSVTACVVARVSGDGGHDGGQEDARPAGDPPGPAGVRAVVTEPDVFAEWRWVRPEEPPGPLFPATAALLAAWHGRPAPAGWTAYPVEAR